MPLTIFAAQIVLEGVRTTTQEPQVIPNSRASMCSQGYRIRSGCNDYIDVLRQVMRDAIPTVDNQRTHWAGAGAFLSVHKVVDDQRPVRPSEQVAQADRLDRGIACIEVCRTLLECVVLDDRALRKTPAKFRDSFPLAHQLDFRQAELVSFGEGFLGFIRQI